MIHLIKLTDYIFFYVYILFIVILFFAFLKYSMKSYILAHLQLLWIKYMCVLKHDPVSLLLYYLSMWRQRYDKPFKGGSSIPRFCLSTH